jgi:hypothetical protein
MPQLFRRRSNGITSLALVATALAVTGILAFGTAVKWATWQTEVEVPLEQPVPFSHKHHVSGLGIDCRYCHTSVTQASTAGLPSSHTCMTCHSQLWQSAKMLEPVRKSFAEGTPIAWNRVNRIPKYVYFNHSIHVNKGVACASCHARIEEMPLTWKTRTFYMRDCLSCHREYIRDHGAPERLTDCYTCHR